VAAVALTLGIVLLFSLVSLALFFAVGGPYGALNDWLIGVSGVLAAALVFTIRSSDLDHASVSRVVLPAVALAGAVLVVVGAGLVISDTTGFLLAGLVESFGFALFGCWLIALSKSMATIGQWPRSLPTLGYATGILLLVGLIVAPGIVMRLDDMDAAHWWVWIGFVGWLGIFVLLPIWSIWLSIAARRASPVGRPTTRP